MIISTISFASRNPGKGVGADGSVSYLYTPEHLEPVLKLWPNSRFIVGVRDPMTLLPSLHKRLIFTGDERLRRFEDAWAAIPERAAGRRVPWSTIEPRWLRYDEGARYGSYVERLFATVGKERCLVMVFDDLVARPGGPASAPPSSRTSKALPVPQPPPSAKARACVSSCSSSCSSARRACSCLISPARGIRGRFEKAAAKKLGGDGGRQEVVIAAQAASCAGTRIHDDKKGDPARRPARNQASPSGRGRQARRADRPRPQPLAPAARIAQPGNSKLASP